MLLGSADVPRALARDHAGADLTAEDRAMLDYAVRLTVDPGSIEEGDVEALRSVGFDDAGILDICQVTAYYNYVNRLADGLGVELEAFWSDEDMTITRAEFDARRDAATTGPDTSE